MKRLFSSFLALVLLFSLASCGKPSPKQSFDYFVMDTVLTVTVLQGDDPAALANACSDIAVAIENKASRTLPQSEVFAFNQAKESYTFSDDMTAILTQALAMCEATGGAYDITVTPLCDLWNVKEGGPRPDEEAIAAALDKVSYQKLTLSGNTLTKADPALAIDLGSAAKGYALGKMQTYLEEAGAVAILNFGGNVALVGKKADGSPWKVSLRDPFSNGTKGKLALASGIVSVAGDSERYFEENGVRYHHILSPFDGYPARGVHSVAVVAEDALLADLLSTALFVMGEEKAREFHETSPYSFSYVMTVSAEKTVVSDDLAASYTP